MWEFDPSLNEWAMTSANSISLAATGYGVYGALGNWAPKNIPGERYVPANWTDSDGNFWLLGGIGRTPSTTLGPAWLNDLWEFKPALNEWAWMGGSSNGYAPGVYGTLGTPAQGNAPGARLNAVTWTDASGNLWLFGGVGDDEKGVAGYLNDLWQYGLKGAPSVLPAQPAATPAFSLAAGTYASAQTLTISDQTPGATIYYTTNGTVPNSNSAVYQGQIMVSSSETVQAIAVANGYSISSLATAAYSITQPPTFTFAATTTSLTVKSGARVTVNLTVTPQNGFNSTVSFTCSRLPAGSSCSFNPASVTPAGAAVSTTLTITAQTLSGALRRESSPLFPESALALAVCVFGWKRRRRLQLVLLVGVALAGLGLASGCGGSGSGSTPPPPPTPTPITSTINVTATSGSIVQSVNLTFTVD